MSGGTKQKGKRNVGVPICYKRNMVKPIEDRERYRLIRAQRKDRYMIEGRVGARCREARVCMGVEEDKGVKKKYGGCF